MSVVTNIRYVYKHSPWEGALPKGCGYYLLQPMIISDTLSIDRQHGSRPYSWFRTKMLTWSICYWWRSPSVASTVCLWETSHLLQYSTWPTGASAVVMVCLSCYWTKINIICKWRENYKLNNTVPTRTMRLWIFLILLPHPSNQVHHKTILHSTSRKTLRWGQK